MSKSAGFPSPQERGPGGEVARWVALLLLLTYFSSCSGLHYIPEKEKLYTGTTVKINSPQKPKNAAALQTELEGVVRPKPNFSFLGLRPKLYFWHLGVGKKKGIGKFLADKLGEAPVLLSQVKIPATEGLMTNRLQNRGYFHAGVTHEVKTKANTAQLHYTAATGSVYIIKEINFPKGDSAVLGAIRSTQAASLLKVGDPYDLNVLTQERVRVDAALKEQGYYYFTPDILLFEVDSTLHNQVTLDVRVKGASPARALRPYWLDQVALNVNYVLTDTTTRKPILYNKYQYFPDERVFRASAITQAVFMYPDSLFRRARRDQTLSRLMSLGTFKFVEIRFNPAAAGDSAGRARLDARVLMTRLPKKNLRAELQFLSKNNGFTGPGLTVAFRDRSALRGAEQLLINATATAETQTRAPAKTESRNNTGLTSTEFGINAQLIVPRLITPDLPLLDVHLQNSAFQPRTTFGAGVRYVTRSGFFSTINYNFSYGYSWKTKITNEQELRPIDIEYSRVSTSDTFQRILDRRPFLRNSFQQQFILGSSYRYTYNEQVLERRQQIFFQGQAEVSGNLAAGLLGAFGGQRTENGTGYRTYRLFNQEFAQYSKFDLELREYYRISANPASGNRLVARLQMGIGLPYGNSRSLPYLRQYGIGGPSSIRAFAARELGPGTYQPKTTGETLTSFYDQVGDLRLEGNVEYRQDLFPYVKGAAFVDAGNIWLVNDDPSRPGGKFSSGTFLQQLAVGAGLGLRIDVQFFVIRFDYAFPLRAGYGKPTNSAGRLNLAIGYPF